MGRRSSCRAANRRDNISSRLACMQLSRIREGLRNAQGSLPSVVCLASRCKIRGQNLFLCRNSGPHLILTLDASKAIPCSCRESIDPCLSSGCNSMFVWLCLRQASIRWRASSCLAPVAILRLRRNARHYWLTRSSPKPCTISTTTAASRQPLMGTDFGTGCTTSASSFTAAAAHPCCAIGQRCLRSGWFSPVIA